MVRGIRVDGVGNSGLMVRGIQDLLCGEFRVDGVGIRRVVVLAVRHLVHCPCDALRLCRVGVQSTNPK